MTKDIEREAFEKALAGNNIHNLKVCTIFDDEKNEYFASDVCDPSEDHIVESINLSWRMWQAAKAHEAEKLKGCVVVPESELKDTFYWPDSEYVVDCPFDYDFELDKGEIQAIEKWQRTKSTKIYFANIYKDDESFEITEFKSLEEAQDAVKENNAYLETQEFFNLSEAVRGGK